MPHLVQELHTKITENLRLCGNRHRCFDVSRFCRSPRTLHTGWAMLCMDELQFARGLRICCSPLRENSVAPPFLPRPLISSLSSVSGPITSPPFGCNFREPLRSSNTTLTLIGAVVHSSSGIACGRSTRHNGVDARLALLPCVRAKLKCKGQHPCAIHRDENSQPDVHACGVVDGCAKNFQPRFKAPDVSKRYSAMVSPKKLRKYLSRTDCKVLAPIFQGHGRSVVRSVYLRILGVVLIANPIRDLYSPPPVPARKTPPESTIRMRRTPEFQLWAVFCGVWNGCGIAPRRSRSQMFLDTAKLLDMCEMVLSATVLDFKRTRRPCISCGFNNVASAWLSFFTLFLQKCGKAHRPLPTSVAN